MLRSVEGPAAFAAAPPPRRGNPARAEPGGPAGGGRDKGPNS